MLQMLSCPLKDAELKCLLPPSPIWIFLRKAFLIDSGVGLVLCGYHFAHRETS